MRRIAWLASVIVAAGAARVARADRPLIVHEISVWDLPATPALAEPLPVPPFVRSPDAALPTLSPEDPAPPGPVNPSAEELRPQDGKDPALAERLALAKLRRVTVRAVTFVQGDAGPLALGYSYPHGAPLRFYPMATAELAATPPRLTFQGRIGGPGRVPALEREHWWTTLRRAASGSLSGGERTGERFFYQEAWLPLEPVFELHRPDASPDDVEGRALTTDERSVLVARADGFVRLTARADGTLRVSAKGDAKALRRVLLAELDARGLSDAEAHAVVEVWKQRLLGAASRAIYFLPRPLTERTLPLAIAPTATATVRLALVVEDL